MKLSQAPLIASALTLFLVPVAAQVDYRLSFEPGGKAWSVEARLDARGEQALDFWFPLWTPGAYHVANFGRFVDGFEAHDGKGHPLEVERLDEGHFRIHTKGSGALALSYTTRSSSDGVISNDVIDVEANRIRPGYAYVNPPSVFGFVAGRIDEPVTLQLEAPAGWKTATVLESDEQGRYSAPSYLRFEDSPFLLSPTLETLEFTVDGKPHAVSVQGEAQASLQELAEGCKKVVEAASGLMNGLPYDRYHFLLGFVPEGSGSGLEHSFSTLILVPEGMPVDEGWWGLVAHEFFHLWTAERIHVQGIHRPDQTQPFQTGTIWVNEGITEYMSHHVLLHAGFMDEQEFLGALTSPLPVQGNPVSWTQVSRDFGSDSEPFMKVAMPFMLKMYMQGPRTILALDLEMRRATHGERGVVDVLHYLQREYVERDRGFAEDEMVAVLTKVAGSDMSAFYQAYIDGPETPDLARSLDVIGYRLEGGRPQALEDASAAQLAARRDLFE